MHQTLTKDVVKQEMIVKPVSPSTGNDAMNENHVKLQNAKGCEMEGTDERSKKVRSWKDHEMENYSNASQNTGIDSMANGGRK